MADEPARHRVTLWQRIRRLGQRRMWSGPYARTTFALQWIQLVLSLAAIGGLGYAFELRRAEPVFGGFAIALFVMAAACTWLGLYPKNLADMFSDFVWHVRMIALLMLIMAVVLGAAAVLVLPH